MSPTIAVAHYPEGAGHATRMLGIADALQSAGATVRMAGGGAGTEFVELNGYDEFEPTTVDYIDTYQDGSVWQTVSQSFPASLGRIADYRAWLDAVSPDALVTDDMFAAMAAAKCSVPLYVLKHDMPGLYRDRIERLGAQFHTTFQLSAAREFFYPAVWPKSSADPDRATRIPPVALDGEPRVREAADVVVVPSQFSSLDHLADRLRSNGYDVINVADDDWDAVPSLLPYIRGADTVVCSGYSTIMDAAVAGTPCVVFPETAEQDAVADWLDRFDVTGFTVVDDSLAALEAIERPLEAPDFDNGAGDVARRVLADLGETATTTSTAAVERRADPDCEVATAAGLGTLVGVPALATAVVWATADVASTRNPAQVGTLASQAAAASGRLVRAVGDGVHDVARRVRRGGS
ncbi:glycosyltransferase [Haloarcula amylovorans]|uniref:glycosyltransferase n=1 Tax=Haloarcula amylovorans TaxID=2562280 RepID=UPI001ADDB8D2|nr:hypothetical protein [Halomicroarcula amylolytica]